ncbi:MAG TPA: phosphodiester glycosidase family protein [Archangium sp.]
MFALVALVLAVPLPFKPLAPGIEYATVKWIEKPSSGDGTLHIVRIDPAKADLHFALASKSGGPNRPAGQWADDLGFTAAINAGMFQKDYATNVGYLRSGEHLNQASWSTDQSVLAFGPGKAALFDLDVPGTKERLSGFTDVIQNLRLIKAGGDRNVWKPTERQWSEAAIAADAKGRILFLFCRSPLTMSEFNDKLLALPLEVTHAMHADGGPPASLSIRAKGLKLDLVGSYESGFRLNDTNTTQWKLPNVLGVSPRP